MDRQLIRRMATAGAFTMLAVRCVVIFSADFYFFPGHADWKRAFLADHFFIANLHWLIGLSVAGILFLLAKNPFLLPEKTIPSEANRNDVAKLIIGMCGGFFWLFFGFGVYSAVIQGAGVRAAACRGNLPEIVFYTRLNPSSLKYRFDSWDTDGCGLFETWREMTRTPNLEHGPTLLHYAAGSGNPELVRYLLDKGLPARDGDPRSHSPLHYALNRSGNAETVRILLAHGADPFSKDFGEK